MNCKLILFSILLGNFGCQAQHTDKVAQETPKAAIPESYNCNLYGLQLKEETYWMAEKQMLFAVAAQGDDINRATPVYKTFQVYTTNDCNMISYILMPENRNDEPYRLFPNTYEAKNELVCAQGYDYTFCFHVRRKEFLLPLLPKYATPRSKTGGNGKPNGLAVWGDYLFGSSTEDGVFAYNLSERTKPQSILPKQEYLDLNSHTFTQLFIVVTEDGEQAFIPQSKNEQLDLQPLLQAGVTTNGRILRDSKLGRFAITRTKDNNSPLVFDLKTGRLLDLPNRIIENKDILAYLVKEYK